MIRKLLLDAAALGSLSAFVAGIYAMAEVASYLPPP